MKHLQQIRKFLRHILPLQKTELMPFMEGDTLIAIRRLKTDQVITIVCEDVQLSEDEKISLADLCRTLSSKLK